MYVAPEVEVIAVSVERGFQASVDEDSGFEPAPIG